MKQVTLEDHHPAYIMKVMNEKWEKLDQRRSGFTPRSQAYSEILAEQQRIENIIGLMKDAE